MRYRHILIGFIVACFLNACATYKAQYKNENYNKTFPKDKKIEHSFFLIGDAGNSELGERTIALTKLENELSQASENSTVLFLGDNIYPSGLPKKGDKNREFAEYQLDAQTGVVKDFNGRTIFIPGNHDWYNDGIKGLKRQEKYIEDKLGKNTFLPENGCPIEKINISDDVVLIIVDSQWYIANWDRQPNINDDCEIKTRNEFFEEYAGLIKKARGKTTIVAVHHPMYTNGPHGGQFSLEQSISPIPGLATLLSVVRKTGGVSPADIQDLRYNEFRKRIITLSQENDKVIFVSGHEHSLQYIIQDNLPQIISGSGSKTTATRNQGGGQFSYGIEGFARLDVFSDGSSHIRFYNALDDEIAFQSEVLAKDIEEELPDYDDQFSKTYTSSVYSKEETSKRKFYTTLWGKRYRDLYGQDVEVPTVRLDTLFGGLTPIRKGGGNQSKSLRLEDKDGREYVMRALRKSALQYLQAVAFKDQYIEGQFNDTYTEGLLLDLFTGAHPYTSLVVAPLADAANVYHTNPVLYYVPKQNTLGAFNADFGDELYIIEERAADGHSDKASFGFSNELISTHDMLSDLRKDEKYKIDEASYIRARLFDMLIGDWDRHQDQWRWARFDEGKDVIYRPVPRDRDQAFSRMSDGVMLNIAMALIPGSRLLRSYDEDIKSVKWFNVEPTPLDIKLIKEANKEVWNAQVQLISNNITGEVINEAFSFLPKELDPDTTNDIKQKLEARLGNLKEISDRYYSFINRYVIIEGTDKDDLFEIERMPNGDTRVSGYRIKKGEKGELFHQRIYNKEETKKIWIYGLDDDDRFEIFGEGDHLIGLKIIGGQNNDIYDIQNGEKVKIYDYKSKPNTFLTSKGRKKLTDNYGVNVFDYKKINKSSNQLIPTIGANPDDGFKIGFVNTFTAYNFERNPFSAKHTLSASYFFATEGVDVRYTGEFARVFGGLNFGIEGVYTSPNFSINFFDFGNSTPNFEPDDLVNLDFNRVRIRTVRFAPSLIWRGKHGGRFKGGLRYESIEVQETPGRFIDTFADNRQDVDADFISAEAEYEFENKDNAAFPTLGLNFTIKAGYTNNLDESEAFGFLIPSLSFDYKLIPSGQLVLASKIKAHINFGDDFKFFQAATIGGNDGLRGFRNQRFSGKSSLYQSTDIRLNLRKLKTGILPLNIGIYGGFDYGRVWINDRFVIDPTFNDDSLNTSIGGGVFLNAANKITGNLSVFNSDDELRIAFALGFGF